MCSFVYIYICSGLPYRHWAWATGEIPFASDVRMIAVCLYTCDQNGSLCCISVRRAVCVLTQNIENILYLAKVGDELCAWRGRIYAYYLVDLMNYNCEGGAVDGRSALIFTQM